jgi:hypothetical protein
VHLSLIQAASQVQDTWGGSYLTRSYAVGQAQEAGPTGLHFVQSVGQRIMLEGEHGTVGAYAATAGGSGTVPARVDTVTCYPYSSIICSDLCDCGYLLP